jgi:hypothetical protein
VTVESVRFHKRATDAKMDVVKNEFRMKLLAKIKEDQMLWINKKGVTKILNRAYEISKDKNFELLKPDEHIKYLEKEFKKCWND